MNDMTKPPSQYNPTVLCHASDVVAANLIGRINFQLLADKEMSDEVRTAMIALLPSLPQMIGEAYDGNSLVETRKKGGNLAILMTENQGMALGWDVKTMLEHGLPELPSNVKPSQLWGLIYEAVNDKKASDEESHALYWALSLRMGKELLEQWVQFQEAEPDRMPVLIVLMAGKTDTDKDGKDHRYVAGVSFIVPLPLTLENSDNKVSIH